MKIVRAGNWLNGVACVCARFKKDYFNFYHCLLIFSEEKPLWVRNELVIMYVQMHVAAQGF